MAEVCIEPSMLRAVNAEIPATVEQALDPQWLSQVLAHLSGGAAVRSVELAELVKAMAAKVRIAVTFEHAPQDVYRLCIKGFLDHDLAPQAANVTTLRESLFFAEIAPRIDMCIPPCAAVVIDREAGGAMLIMADMIAAGAHFYDAMDPLTTDDVAQTLEQLAALHARAHLAQSRPWLPCRLQDLTTRQSHIGWDEIQSLMHDDRRGALPARTLDATLLRRGLERLAERNASAVNTLLHGDCHPGNLYRNRDGRLGFTDWQLVQRGHWSLDVAYHIASTLPVEIAEQDERRLLNHYLDALRSHGGEAADAEGAWQTYRAAMIYGYYHWAITRRVHPPITHRVFNRLGEAVTRHDSYRLLGL